MRIFLTIFNAFGNSSRCSLKGLTPETTVLELQKMIFERLEVPISRQQLTVYRGGVKVRMCGTWKLEFFEIKENTTVYMEKIVEEAETVVFNFQQERQLHSNKSSGAAGAPPGIDRKGSLLNYLAKLQTSSKLSKRGEAAPLRPSAKAKGEKIETLLQYARNGNLLEMIDLLDTDNELDPFSIDVCGIGGWNCLHYAVYCGHHDITKELLKRGADVDVETHDEWTSLQMGAYQGHAEIVSLLLSAPRIKIDHKTSKRGTALHCACQRSNKAIVSILLQRGADPKITNSHNLRPIDIAIQSDIIDMLKDRSGEVAVEAKEEMPVAVVDEDIKKIAEEESFEPPKPDLRKGWMKMAGALVFNENLRYFVLNPEDGTFIRFKKLDHYPNKPRQVIPIKDIYAVKRVKDGWFQREGRFYFELTYKSRHILSCEEEADANGWVQALNQSIIYCQHIGRLNNEKYKQIKSTFNAKLPGRSTTPESKSPRTPVRKNTKDNSSLMLASPTTTGATSAGEDDKDNRSSVLDRSTDNSNQQSPRMPHLNNIPRRSYDGDSGSNSNSDNDLDKSGDFSEPVNFSSFELLREVGSGSFGKVYLARLKSSGQIYAMKVLRKQHLINRGQLKYAITECKVLKMIKSDFIVHLHYAFQTPHYLYLILDYCPGGDLGYHLENLEVFPEKLTKFYIAELILAIEYIHEKDIIYRDLKPENILLDSDGHIKLADFGLAKDGVNQDHSAKSFCGSPAYLSPEMLNKRGVGKAADLYGIGTILYEMLVGISPYYDDSFEKLSKKILTGKLKLPRGVSQKAKELIVKFLDRDPSKRIGFNSMEEIKRDPFFDGIDWEALARKEVNPPKILAMEDDFLPSLKPRFTDRDYADGPDGKPKKKKMVVPEYAIHSQAP